MLKFRRRLKDFISEQLKLAGKIGAEVNYVFCSDEELLEINRKHLDHDYYTDIITFDLSEHGSSFLLSDIFISVDRVKDNALNNGVDMPTELLRVVFHGALHLIGYKDKTKKEAEKMREVEEQWLRVFEKDE